ncbi:putative uncharacterized protein CLP1 [Rhodotorula toruloides ATCC 204091]|uniref:Clp1-like protein n=1 Tax=Rhodotorula toruloides TaxID=5286 RepID=A0A0K3CG14_RHOTO|nr:putative uncharacterized protein CLP1 [Rhodotorula toruloides ATCC 204091]
MSDANALIQDDPAPPAGPQPFGPFLTPSGSLRVPSTLPQFPALAGRVPTPDDSRPATPEDGVGQADPLAELGAKCLEAATRTTIQPHLVYDPGGGDSTTRSFALCIAPPATLPLPTHVLHLTFSACGETLLIPIHQTIWAVKTRLFARPDSPLPPPPPPWPPLSRQNLISLPIVRFSVPFKTIWSILYEYVHTGSTAAVLADLLAHQVPPSPLSAEPPEVQQYQMGALIAKLERIRRLWHNVVALGAENEELWEALARAWAVLLAELTEELEEPV